MRKIKTGDEIIVIAGKCKGERGNVTHIDENKVKVEGVNLVKRHTRANPNAGVEGGIVEKEAFMQISNVALFNSVTGKADRVGFKFLENGSKVRFFKSNGELIDA